MRTSTYSRFGLILIVALVAAFAAAPAAFAQDNSPEAANYGPSIPTPLGTGESGTAGTQAAGGNAVPADDTAGLNSSIGSLPFTGMDLLILGGVAILLTGTGFALRRLSTPRGPTA